MEEPDPAAIRAAAAGDVDAFTRLVRAYQTPVWRFVTRLCGDRTLAEDVTQETFLRAYRHLPAYRFRSKFSTWLFQIARNTTIDAQRAASRRDRMHERVRPARDAPASDATTYLDAGLAALDPKLKEALVTVEVLGYTYREASAILDAPEGTVKRRVHDARVRLAAWMAEGEAAGEL